MINRSITVMLSRQDWDLTGYLPTHKVTGKLCVSVIKIITEKDKIRKERE